MTASEFTALLTNNSLNGLSEQDLEKALEQFPYCQPLRLMLLKKYYDDQHPKRDEQLKLAATYAADRSYLFRLLSDHQSSEVEEESITDDLADPALEDVAVHVAPPDEGTTPESEEYPQEEDLPEEAPFDLTTESTPNEKNQPEMSILEGDVEIVLEVEKEEPQLLEISELGLDPDEIGEVLDSDEPSIEISIDEKGNLDLSDILSSQIEMPSSPQKKQAKSKTEKKNRKKKRTKKNKRSKVKSRLSENESDNQLSFAEWVASLSEKRKSTSKKSGKKKSKKAKAKIKKEKPSIPEKKTSPKKPPVFSDQSLSEHSDNISETLAGLLVLQGNKAKAIEMYERLILKFPEKSTYFAVKIEKLKS